MKIEIYQLTQGAKLARGLAVVIDVFRAFSLACYLADRGVKTIIPVGNLEEAYNLKNKIPGSLLFGERNERMPEGFDHGNSPSQIEHLDFSGKTIIHTTSAGTQGLVLTRECDEVLTGSFVNAEAIVRYIQFRNPDVVSLVCMGYSGLEPADEDTFCAQWIEARLQGETLNFSSIVNQLRSGSGRRLLDPLNQGHSPARDFEMCTALNRFDFVLKATRMEDYMSLQKINI